MFLLVMLGILVWRVYVVIHPEPPKESIVTPPRPEIGENFPQDKKPGEPVAEPELPPPSDWSSLWTRNPFTYFSELSQQSAKDAEGKAVSIELLDIQNPKGAPRVLLGYGSTKKWHKEGDSFVSYKLQSINVEEKTCEVYSEKEGRDVVLRLKTGK